MKKYIFIIFILLFLGCGTTGGIPEVNVYCALPNNNDIYVFEFPDNQENSNFIVFAQTKINTRVYWSSPDSFFVYQDSISTRTCIIDGITESDSEEGIAENIVEIDSSNIGDTVKVIGLVYGEDFSDDGSRSDTIDIVINP